MLPVDTWNTFATFFIFYSIMVSCHLIIICLLSIELDIFHNRMWDICSFYAVQVLLSPMVSVWTVGWSLGQVDGLASVITCPSCILSTIRGRMLSLKRDIVRHWFGGIGVQHHSITLI